MKNLGLS